MTESARPVLRPVTITPRSDLSDEQLAQFAARQGVGTLVRPGAQPPAVASQIAQDAPKEDVRTTPTAPVPRKAPAAKKTGLAAKPADELPDLKLSLQVPGYVGDELHIRSAHDRCTVRHLVLKGLHAIGLPIKEEDLIPDERRNIYRKGTR